MSNHANVTSLEQLADFLERSQSFRAQLAKELENLQLELNRISQWIDREARDYWTAELRVAHRQFVECQQALVRCTSYVRENERRPCTEEKKRLHRAQARRSLCEQKLKVVQAAASAWEREQHKNSTKIERCRDLADSQMAVAIHQLSLQLERLESYASLKVTSPKSSKPGTTDAGISPSTSSEQKSLNATASATSDRASDETKSAGSVNTGKGEATR